MASWRVLYAVALAGVLAAAAQAGDLEGVLKAYQAGRYEDVIAQTTAVIEADEKAAQVYPYLRGMAAYHIAWFGQAEADLAPLGDFRLNERWPLASELVGRVRYSRELAPASIREIAGAGRVLFRVYYDVDDKWTRTLMNVLADVHQRVSGFYGVTMAETAVFVFADKGRHVAFIKALTGEEPQGWAWASGGNGMLIFCPFAPDNNYRESASQLPEIAAHEFSHCLTHRVLGTAAMPMWLDEGLAMYCAAFVRPQKANDNDIYLTRMWTADQILPLRAVANRDTFYDSQIAAGAYVQAYAMVRFLVSELGRDGVMGLLNLLREGGRFDAAMGQVWDGGLEGFFEDWLAATERRVEKFR